MAATPAAAKGLAQADGDSHNGSHAQPPPGSHGASGTDATAAATTTTSNNATSHGSGRGRAGRAPMVCGVVSALAVCASVCLVAVYAHVRITEVEWQLEQAQAASFESKVSMRESLSGVQGGVELLTTLFAEWREKAEAEAVRRYDGTSRKTTAALGELEELQYRVALHQRFTCGMLQWLVGWSSGLYGNAKARSQLLSVLLSVQQHAASLVASCGEIHAHGGQVVHLMRRLGSGSCGAGDGDMGGGGGVGGSSDCSAPESSGPTENNTTMPRTAVPAEAAEWRMQRWCQRVHLSAPLCLD